MIRYASVPFRVSKCLARNERFPRAVRKSAQANARARYCRRVVKFQSGHKTQLVVLLQWKTSACVN